jgi:hypothetical protein
MLRTAEAYIAGSLLSSKGLPLLGKEPYRSINPGIVRPAGMGAQDTVT